MSNIKEFKFKAGSYTPLEKYMNPFWEFIVSKLPIWLTPNLITVIGFIVNVLICLWNFLKIYNKESCTRFEVLIIIFGMFFY